MSTTDDIHMRIIEEVQKLDTTKRDLVCLTLRLVVVDILLRKTEDLLKEPVPKEEEFRAEANVILRMINEFRGLQ